VKLTEDRSIWLQDIQSSVPKQARLDGFDISFDAVPPAELFPPNVNFQHWNVNEDIPDGMVGTFDIIHVRFFAFVLHNDRVSGVVAKLFKMLSMS
jgi:hypothetical protein